MINHEFHRSLWKCLELGIVGDEVQQRVLSHMTRGFLDDNLKKSRGQSEISPLTPLGFPVLWVSHLIVAGQVEASGEAILLCTKRTSKVPIISS